MRYNLNQSEYTCVLTQMVLIPRNNNTLIYLCESFFYSTELLWSAFYKGDAYTIKLSNNLR